MRQSQLFTKTRRDAPKDEEAKNAQLLIRAGYVHKEMAGVYSYLPLGVRVLQNIEKMVREAMDSIGGQELRMATLHPAEPWKTSGGWDNVDVLFKVQSRTEKEYALGQSEEEIVTPIASEYAMSYKDLPLAVYQIGQKYRDELRAKSGIMRGREFGMKDMYSFHATQEDFERFYQIVKDTYLELYTKAGLVAKVTEASGGSFSDKLSYEFMVLTDAGEDDIVYCDQCTHCANVEVAKEKEGDTCPKCGKGTLAAAKASEVGNVFDLGLKYAKAFNFTYKDAEGKEQYPIMGCYGLGTTRLMGVIVEALADDKGIVWPEAVAPFMVHIVSVVPNDATTVAYADALYDDLKKAGVSVLYDDRDARAGEKLADADLIGIPCRVVIGKNTLESGKIESTYRRNGEVKLISRDELIAFASAATEHHG
ncbi:MAG: aminoacyl--tRNA ligase-related protein [Patescibacteria group bacterium]